MSYYYIKGHRAILSNRDAVNRPGFCAVCRRAGSEYSGKAVKRGISKKE